jgi:xanthine dehydrogenase YagT iron-sulfur-binding subunit
MYPDDHTPDAASSAPQGPSRRSFLKQTGGLLGVALAPPIASQAEALADKLAPASPILSGQTNVSLHINGQAKNLRLEPRTTLLDALRENLDLTGTKKGCDHGQCGACTVHLDGKRVNSCLTLAIMAQGKQITTIEGLAKGEELHPMQEAFLKHDGFQ